MTSTENNKIFANDGTDISPNVQYRYNEEKYEDEDENTHKFSQKDLIMCNTFFSLLHVHKSIESGNYQEPIWNLAIPNTDIGKHKIIKLPHSVVYSPLKVMRAFQGVGFAGFPAIFSKKGKGFLWEHFMQYAIVEFEDPAIVEEDPLDTVLETFVCKLCELPQRDEEFFYTDNSSIGSVFEKNGILCLSVKTTTIDSILEANKTLPKINILAAKLHEKKLKIRRTWQHEGRGVRIWSFPVDKLEPYGFKVITKKKVTHESAAISKVNDVFTFTNSSKKPEIIDGRTGECRGEL